MGKAIVEPTGDKRCPVCKRDFFVQWPKQWAYARGEKNKTYFCSWKCLRSMEKAKEERHMGTHGRDRLKVAEELIGILAKNGSPFDYLRGLGYGNPAQAYYDIKAYCRDTAPDLYEKFLLF